MLIRTKSPGENRLRCDTVWGFFNFSHTNWSRPVFFSFLTSIGFILELLWHALLYLWAISLRKLIYLMLLFLVNNLNMIPLIVQLKRSTILAFRSENFVENLIWYFLRKFCTWKFKNSVPLSVCTITSFLFVCSSNLVSALGLTATTHLLHKQSQGMFEKFDI